VAPGIQSRRDSTSGFKGRFAGGMRMRDAGRWLFPLIVVVLLVYLASQTFLPGDDDDDRIAYSDLITRVEDSPESIADVLFVPENQRIEVTLADGSKLESNYPTEPSQLELQRKLESSGVHFDSKGTGDSSWWSILTYLLPFVLFFGFWIFLMRQVQSRKSGEADAGSVSDPDPGDAYPGGTSRY
jgi:ATP-dependent Zn protease